MSTTRKYQSCVTHATYAAELALTDLRPALDDAVHAVRAERDRLASRLAGLGLGVHESDANFLWVRVPGVGRATELHRALAASGVLVRAFAGPAVEPRVAEHLRITVGTPAEDDALLDALVAIGTTG